MSIAVIIPAAGVGARFGGTTPKQYLALRGTPMIVRTIGVFVSIQEVNTIIVAVHASMLHEAQLLIDDFFPRRVLVTEGGDERQHSIHKALLHPAVANAEIILVHDAVRPFASTSLVRSVIGAAQEYGAAIPALSPKETIKQIGRDGFVQQTYNRSTLVSVQTPQGFKREVLMESYALAQKDRFNATDDASVVEYAGYQVRVVEGEDDNIKVTTQRDFAVAEMILNQRMK